MPAAIKPTRIVSQASLKEVDCLGGCGTKVLYRTNPRVSCADCRASRIKECARLTAERKRRTNGVEPVKGTPFTCSDCGVIALKTSRRDTTACQSCMKERQRKRARQASKARSGIPGAYAAQAAWYKRKRQSDPVYAINFRMRAAVRRSLKGGKFGRAWEALVGYSAADLLAHLERQFLPSMSWANRADWEIDHIVPLAAFEFRSAEDQGFRAAWALSNLRPLWSAENRTKNAHRTHLI